MSDNNGGQDNQQTLVPKYSKQPGRLKRGLGSTLMVPLTHLGPLFGRHRIRPLDTPERREAGMVIVLSGIEGEGLINHNILIGLADAGLPYALTLFRWTIPIPILAMIYNLRGLRRNIRQAERLVDLIVEYRKNYPGRPVHLVGHSGGGAMSILTLERLPAGVNVDSAVLCASALSPGYDLTKALSHVNEKVYNLRSVYDWFHLWLATTVLGTVDGKHTVSSGAIGFRLPENADAETRRLYEARLVEIPFTKEMKRSFHFTGHFGYVNRLFVEEWIAPLLESSDQVIPSQARSAVSV